MAIPYYVISFISVLIFAGVHLYARFTRNLNRDTHGRFLSICGGVAISYVFIDILPKLSESEPIIRKALSGVFPFFENHVYVMALIGFLVFFMVDRSHMVFQKGGGFYLSLFSYACFNFLVAYAVVDPNNTEVQPIALFTLAMGLHYFTNDYSLNKEHGMAYNSIAKWILIFSLFLGWIIGCLYVLSEAAVAIISAFIAGGVILNVTRHELPKDTPHSLGAFIFSALAYTTLLLLI